MRAIVSQGISESNNLGDGGSARTTPRQEERKCEVRLHTTAAPVPSCEHACLHNTDSSMTYRELLVLCMSVTEGEVQRK